MRRIYLDSEFKCHVSDAEMLTPVDTDIFDLFCDEAIECMRYIPYGCVWEEDGKVFHGEFIRPINNRYIDIQKQYLRDIENTMPLSDVAELIKLIYEDDLEVIG